MKMNTRLAALVLAAALAAPLLASAQQGHGHGERPGPRDSMRARMCEDLDARLAARLAWLEAKVKPSDAQRPAWEEFQRESRAAAEPMRAQCAAGEPRPPHDDLAGELGRREQRMAEMLEATRRVRAAVEKLQPQLDEAQRKAMAENFHGGRMGQAMHRRLHHGHHEHHGHGPQHGQGMRQGG